MSKVSIVVLPYLESKKHYLDLCIKSIKNLDYPKEDIEIVVVGRGDYVPTYEGVKTVVNPKAESVYAVGINYGIQNTDPKSKFIMTLNDDVILTRNSLKNMVKCGSDYNCMINAVSPCDNYNKYELHIGFNKDNVWNVVDCKQFRYEDMKHAELEFMNADSLYPDGIFKQESICTYATLIPRALIDKVGLFDELFENGLEDIDFSWRVNAAGGCSYVSLSALIWHFSGVTASEMIGSRRDEVTFRNLTHFKYKWGVLPEKGIEKVFKLLKDKFPNIQSEADHQPV